MAELAGAWLGSVRFGLARLEGCVFVRLVSVRCGKVRLGVLGTGRQGEPRLGMVSPGLARQARLGMARRCSVWLGSAGLARNDGAGLGLACIGMES